MNEQETTNAILWGKLVTLVPSLEASQVQAFTFQGKYYMAPSLYRRLHNMPLVEAIKLARTIRTITFQDDYQGATPVDFSFLLTTLDPGSDFQPLSTWYGIKGKKN